MEYTTNKIMTFGQQQAVEAANQWWADQYQALDRSALSSMRKYETEIARLKAENENLKAKLENRDLNLEHLRSTIEKITDIIKCNHKLEEEIYLLSAEQSSVKLYADSYDCEDHQIQSDELIEDIELAIYSKKLNEKKIKQILVDFINHSE